MAVKIVVEREVVDGGVLMHFWATKEGVRNYRKYGVLLCPDNVFGEFKAFTKDISLKEFLKLNGVSLTQTELNDLVNELKLNMEEFEKKYNCAVFCVDITVKNGEDIIERTKQVEKTIVNWFRDFVRKAKEKGIFKQVQGIKEYDV